jgi:phage-related protein
MSDFNYQPSYNVSITKAPRIKAVSFGDGYQQRVADGINNTPQQWALNFQASKDDIIAIDAFLSARNGLLAFTWTPSGMAEITVICRDWSRNIIAPNAGTISAKFEQVFE